MITSSKGVKETHKKDTHPYSLNGIKSVPQFKFPLVYLNFVWNKSPLNMQEPIQHKIKISTAYNTLI